MALTSMDPQTLAEYILGDVHAGPGLLRRVEARVDLLTHDPGPAFKSSSIMEIGSSGSSWENDEGDVPKVLELAVALLQWHNGGAPEPSQVSERLLVRRLRDWQVTDAEYLRGCPRVGAGLLSLIRREVRAIFTAEIPQTERATELSDYLRRWLGEDCVHEWERMPSDDPAIIVRKCHCGARHAVDPKRGTWLAV